MKRKLTIVLFLLANILLIAGPFIPHHHHEGQENIPCYVLSHCEGQSACGHHHDAGQHDTTHRHCVASHTSGYYLSQREEKCSIVHCPAHCPDCNVATIRVVPFYDELSLQSEIKVQTRLKNIPYVKASHILYLTSASLTRGTPALSA